MGEQLACVAASLLEPVGRHDETLHPAPGQWLLGSDLRHYIVQDDLFCGADAGGRTASPRARAAQPMRLDEQDLADVDPRGREGAATAQLLRSERQERVELEQPARRNSEQRSDSNEQVGEQDAYQFSYLDAADQQLRLEPRRRR